MVTPSDERPRKSADAFEEAFLNEYPNPHRIGCPGDEIIKGLASRKLLISHPARIHIGQCSPCWREFRSFEARIKRTRRWTLISSFAASILILLLGPYLYWFAGQRKSGPMVALDLRLIDPTRGSDLQHPKLYLPQRVFPLVITLPWGSNGGIYEIQFRNSNGLVVAKARGTAAISDGDTRLKIEWIDLSNVSKGDYEVILVHGGERLKADVTVP